MSYHYNTNFLRLRAHSVSRRILRTEARIASAPRYPSVVGRGYDGKITLINALKIAPQPLPGTIKDGLSKVDFDGAGFDIHMSPEGGARLSVRVLLVQKGALVPVD